MPAPVGGFLQSDMDCPRQRVIIRWCFGIKMGVPRPPATGCAVPVLGRKLRACRLAERLTNHLSPGSFGAHPAARAGCRRGTAFLLVLLLLPCAQMGITQLPHDAITMSPVESTQTRPRRRVGCVYWNQGVSVTADTMQISIRIQPVYAAC